MNKRIYKKLKKRLFCKHYNDYKNGFQVINVIDVNGKSTRMKVRFMLADTTKPNRNGRIYKAEVIEGALKELDKSLRNYRGNYILDEPIDCLFKGEEKSFSIESITEEDIKNAAEEFDKDLLNKILGEYKEDLNKFIGEYDHPSN